MRGFGGAGTLGTRTAWNRWGNPYWRSGWNGGWGGWVGPVFWPYFYGDLLAFSLWPYDYYDPFWAYGDIFVWNTIFWPGPYYAYGPAYFDVYGEYGDYGYYRGPAHGRVARAPNGDREITGSTISGNELAQTCGGLAPGVTDLPIGRIGKTIDLTNEQLKALDALKAASSQASDILKASCSSEISLTPLGRIDTVQKRLDGMIQAWIGAHRSTISTIRWPKSKGSASRHWVQLPTHGRTAVGLLRATIWLRSAAAARKVSRSCLFSA